MILGSPQSEPLSGSVIAPNATTTARHAPQDTSAGRLMVLCGIVTYADVFKAERRQRSSYCLYCQRMGPPIIQHWGHGNAM